MRIIRLDLHDGPMWALPKVSTYLHMDSTDYFEQCMLHGLLPQAVSGVMFSRAPRAVYSDGKVRF
jgi:hypothetical protein